MVAIMGVLTPIAGAFIFWLSIKLADSSNSANGFFAALVWNVVLPVLMLGVMKFTGSPYPGLLAFLVVLMAYYEMSFLRAVAVFAIQCGFAFLIITYVLPQALPREQLQHLFPTP